jgi:hypothetical protein
VIKHCFARGSDAVRLRQITAYSQRITSGTRPYGIGDIIQDRQVATEENDFRTVISRNNG